MKIRPGDWLLIRNPSPYNSFTDLGQGLFTHVGVVTECTDRQGRRHFVVVEMPERGDRIPHTNVEEYLSRSLHYLFLRHQDEQIAVRMGQVANTLIGRSTQFDLTFQTELVLALKGRLDEVEVINTYCAGFLLVCAQETTARREDFFPIPESAPAGHCQDNLAKLGLSIGKDFVSPTGPIFSPHLQLVGRREPMYSPGREVKEAVYDHFANSMVERQLTPSPNGYQLLREKLAGLSQSNPWLAKAIAKSNNVSHHMDLHAAAKVAAVVETLDEVAESQAKAFSETRQAITAGPIDLLAEEGVAQEELDRIRKLRQNHLDLFDRWDRGLCSPRQLRVELVRHFIQQGQKAIDQRFFATNDSPADPSK